MPWYCKRCSFINKDEEQTCSQCGQERTITQYKIKDREEPTEPSVEPVLDVVPSKKSYLGLGLLWGLSIGLVIAAVIYVIFQFISMQDKEERYETKTVIPPDKPLFIVPPKPIENILYVRVDDAPLYDYPSETSSVKEKLRIGQAVVSKDRRRGFRKVQLNLRGKYINGWMKTAHLRYRKV
jgi:hypothetical protein